MLRAVKALALAFACVACSSGYGQTCYIAHGDGCPTRFVDCHVNFCKIRSSAGIEQVATEIVIPQGSVALAQMQLLPDEDALNFRVYGRSSDGGNIDPAALIVSIDGRVAERIEAALFRVPDGSRRIVVEVGFAAEMVSGSPKVEIEIVKLGARCEVCSA